MYTSSYPFPRDRGTFNLVGIMGSVAAAVTATGAATGDAAISPPKPSPPLAPSSSSPLSPSLPPLSHCSIVAAVLRHRRTLCRRRPPPPLPSIYLSDCPLGDVAALMAAYKLMALPLFT